MLAKQRASRPAGFVLRFLLVLLSASVFCANAQQQPTLQFADRPVLVNCELANAPCFRLKFNIVGPNGAPAPVELPPANQLASNLTIHIGGKSVTPFFVSAEKGASTDSMRPRIVMLLIDISGSMRTILRNGLTRFDAAKSAASMFLNGFESGTDKIAIVPFGSHNVEQMVRNAQFATTREQAQAQIDSLKAPSPRENTGLFTAVSAALDVLARQSHAAPGSEVLLVVMTDGQNDVERGDDAGLLSGEQGLSTVASKVQTSGIAVHAIGFGDKKDIDQAALGRIGTKFDMTEDPDDLKRLFTVSRALLNSRMRATLESPWKDRASLAGKDLVFTADLSLPSGEVLHSEKAKWSAPEMDVPSFQDKCEPMEARALLARPKLPDSTGWLGMAILRPLAVFVGFGVLLSLLWFGLPRLIWPERYEPQEVALRPDRWVAQTQFKESPRRRKAPAGFEKSAATVRGAADKTSYRPRTDFSSTRTRLD